MGAWPTKGQAHRALTTYASRRRLAHYRTSIQLELAILAVQVEGLDRTAFVRMAKELGLMNRFYLSAYYPFFCRMSAFEKVNADSAGSAYERLAFSYTAWSKTHRRLHWARRG